MRALLLFSLKVVGYLQQLKLPAILPGAINQDEATSVLLHQGDRHGPKILGFDGLCRHKEINALLFRDHLTELRFFHNTFP